MKMELALPVCYTLVAILIYLVWSLGAMTMWADFFLLIKMNTCFSHKHIFNFIIYALIRTQTFQSNAVKCIPCKKPKTALGKIVVQL